MDMNCDPMPNRGASENLDIIQIPENGQEHEYSFGKAQVRVNLRRVDGGYPHTKRVDIHVKAARDDGDENAHIEEMEVKEHTQSTDGPGSLLSVSVYGCDPDCERVIGAYKNKYGDPVSASDTYISPTERNTWMMWNL